MTTSQVESIPLKQTESIQPLKVEPNSSLANLMLNFKFQLMNQEAVVESEEENLHEKFTCDKNVLEKKG
uniref:Uncharacterized protein n=1 Tax=Panagrolaimus sp. PS1159 TaxID=55785 RepID=A0AC35GHT5_9BILA